MRGKKAKAIRRSVYGDGVSRRNEGLYMWQDHPPGGKTEGRSGGLMCARKRGVYRAVKRMVKQGLKVEYDGSQDWIQEG